MVINWYGEGCFKVQTGGLTLLTDPLETNSGLSPARGKIDITVKTLVPWPLPPNLQKEHQIAGGGEYEIQGINVKGFSLPGESSEKFIKTVYKITAEEVPLGFLGHLSEELPANVMENLKDSQILFIPAGGKPFLNQEKAAKIIKQLDPKIVVASFFKIPGLKRTSADWKALAEEMGQKSEMLEKLTVRKKELQEQKGVKLIILKL